MKSIVQRGALGVSFAIKSVDEKARRFTGLASTWQKDLGDDVIHKGAFKKTLADWRGSRTKTIPLLDSHDRWSVDSILGKMIDGSETSDGLETEFEMRATEKAEQALDAIKNEFVTGLSIGYEPVKFDFEQPEGSASPWDRIRHLHEVKLREVSLVVFPMNEGARVDPSSVKSLLDAAKAGQLTDDQKAELLAFLNAAPTSAAPEAPTPDAPKGLAPDNPRRIAMSEMLRGLTLRSLTR
jgi:HK97 family phage prohead protease